MQSWQALDWKQGVSFSSPSGSNNHYLAHVHSSSLSYNIGLVPSAEVPSRVHQTAKQGTTPVVNRARLLQPIACDYGDYQRYFLLTLADVMSLTLWHCGKTLAHNIPLESFRTTLLRNIFGQIPEDSPTLRRCFIIFIISTQAGVVLSLSFLSFCLQRCVSRRLLQFRALQLQMTDAKS